MLSRPSCLPCLRFLNQSISLLIAFTSEQLSNAGQRTHDPCLFLWSLVHHINIAFSSFIHRHSYCVESHPVCHTACRVTRRGRKKLCGDQLYGDGTVALYASSNSQRISSKLVSKSKHSVGRVSAKSSYFAWAKVDSDKSLVHPSGYVAFYPSE